MTTVSSFTAFASRSAQPSTGSTSPDFATCQATTPVHGASRDLDANTCCATGHAMAVTSKMLS